MTIKELRLNKGLSQKQFADLVNVSVSTVYRWEQLKTAPSMEQYRAMQRIFGFEVMDAVMFGGADNE